ncbi:MAG: S8 family serine peptidase [Candidatus Eremiobacteraeota bacterium]|nr:S8 family serine peptidase [Candidatus Eremiobacteraeota bacterium]MBV8366850.1 S8 family serine peptidase [Candidatus Eremiobacteraeota bacterium]
MAFNMPFVRRRLAVAPQEPYVRGKLIIKFSNEVQAEQILSRRGATRIAPPNAEGYVGVSIPQTVDPAAEAAFLQTQPGIADAQPLKLRYIQVNDPNDTDFGTNAQICSGPQTTHVQWDMFVTWMPEAWAVTTGSSSVKIAIIDTGVDLTQGDISSKVIGADSAVFDTGLGTQDGTNVQDYDGHGTNVSGIAAADTNNSTLFAGTGWNTSLIEVRVFPTPSAANPTPGATNLDIAAGINWAVSKGAKVVSMSLGGSGACDSTEQTAISNAIASGIVVVAASGNAGAAAVSAPANCNGVIAVGASSLDDTTNPLQPREKVASYSNYASNNTWGVVAPGGDPSAAQQNCNPVPPCDYLQWITNLYSSTAFGGGGAGVFIAGTSQATPHVAGLAALMFAKDGALTPAQVANIIESNTDQIVGAGFHQGFGRINAIKALNATP